MTVGVSIWKVGAEADNGWPIPMGLDSLLVVSTGRLDAEVSFRIEAGVMSADSDGVGSAPPKILAEEEGFLAEVSPRAGFCIVSGGDFLFPVRADEGGDLPEDE